jgi:hypothetical protein
MVAAPIRSLASLTGLSRSVRLCARRKVLDMGGKANVISQSSTDGKSSRMEQRPVNAGHCLVVCDDGFVGDTAFAT